MSYTVPYVWNDQPMYSKIDLVLSGRLFSSILPKVHPKMGDSSYRFIKTKNSCPLCRERIRVLKCKNNVYEVRAVPERTRVPRPPAPSPQIQQRRIVILPVVMYPQPGCFFYTQPSSLFLGASISSLSGLNYPLGAPSFFIPSSL